MKTNFLSFRPLIPLGHSESVGEIPSVLVAFQPHITSHTTANCLWSLRIDRYMQVDAEITDGFSLSVLTPCDSSGVTKTLTGWLGFTGAQSELSCYAGP